MTDHRPITHKSIELPGERLGRNAAIWLLCEAIQMDSGKVPPLAQVRDAGIAAGFNKGNIEVEYGCWRRHHGHPSQG